MNGKKLIFSINLKDLDVTYFSGTGSGGQNRNRHMNCVRIKHPETGVIVTGQSHKEKRSNLKEALNNLKENSEFKIWVNKVVCEKESGETIEQKVEKQMAGEFLIVEVQDENNR